MKLTPRLAALAELVPAGSIVADIGTDHAYLPIYLVQEQISRRVIASDMHQAPLAQARAAVATFNCRHKIELRLGDGLQVLRTEDEVDTVVIAGLGGRTIALLLEEGREKLNGVQQLILQPMTDAGVLRVYLAHHGFALAHESLVLEGRRIYEVILARPGQEKEDDQFRLALGPRLLEDRPPLLARLLREKIHQLKTACHNMQKARRENIVQKIREVEQELSSLEEVLAGATFRADAD